MKMHTYKLKALVKKDFQNVLKNKNILILLIIPIFFALLYNNFIDTGDMPKEYLLMLCTIMNLAMIPISSMGMMIAEEKEKNTLRTLMLSNISSNEFLISKALICTLLATITNTIIYLIIGLDTKFLFAYLLITTAVVLTILFFGAIVGLLAKDQMSTGMLSTPIMLLFMFPIFFTESSTILNTISKAIPTRSMMTLFEIYTKSGIQNEMFLPILVIIIWLVLGVILFNLMFRKRGFDN